MYYGSWKIDDLLTFAVNTHSATTGAATDADSVPTYRVYEDEIGTAILTGSMAKLDDANTTGFYSEQITLSAANGFEKGKCYTIYISATVSSVTGTAHHNFQVEAEVDANTVSPTVVNANVTQISGDATAADNEEAFFDGTGYAGTNNVIPTVTTVNELAAGSITAAVIATDAIDNDAIAANAVTEIQSGLSTLDADSVRSAIGLASANLDTQLDALPTNAELTTALGIADDAVLAAIAALNNLSSAQVTTVLTAYFAANIIDGNVKQVNDVNLTGNGSTVPWGPA